MGLNEPAMLAEVMTSHRSMSSPTTSSFRSGQELRGHSGLFPPWRRRSNDGRRKGEGIKENGGGRGRACESSSKLRGKGEESVDGRQFATVHEEAPRPTCPFGNCTKGLVVVSLTCWNGTTCQRNMVCNFSCKMRSSHVGPRCRISYRPLFF